MAGWSLSAAAGLATGALRSALLGAPWLLTAVLLTATATTAAAQEVVPYTVRGDGIDTPLTSTPGDPARGRAIAASRQQGLCLLCHGAPMPEALPEARFQGNLAPDLAGVGARYTEAQLRLRVVEARRVHPGSFMPSFHSTANLSRVGGAWQGKPILTAQQVEDVVAWLLTLR